MKNLLFLLALIPTLAFSQVSSWRSSGTTSSSSSQRSTPSVQQSTPQRNDVSDWRRNPPPTPKPNYNVITRPNNWRWGGNNWGWQWNNWGWYQPYPYIWYDDWGWRQRSIVRVYETGRRDTIVKKPVYFAAGLGYTNDKRTQFWTALGNDKGYFIADYVLTTAVDQNDYFPNGNLAIVDFPVSDELFRKDHTFYIGGGKRFNKLGVHGMIGFGNEVLRYQGKDIIGGISFPKSNISYTTFKVGVIRDFKWFTLKLDHDPIRKYSQIGIGLNNR